MHREFCLTIPKPLSDLMLLKWPNPMFLADRDGFIQSHLSGYTSL